MARGVGLDPGEFAVKVVEIDGSLRRARLSKVRIEPVPENGGAEGHARQEAKSAWHALKDAHVSREDVTLAVPCRDAVLRNLTLPFVGADQIRKVVKFEAEGEIHSHNVDDMIVDFSILAEDKAAGQTRVLVVAVPKHALKLQLGELERAGIEPESADLDLIALHRVANWCGALTGPLPGDGGGPIAEPTGGEAPADGAAVPARPAARLVLDVGARTTRALLAVGGAIADLRGLRLGADSIAAELASRHGVTMAQAREAVRGLAAGGDDEVYAIVDGPEAEAAAAEPTTALAPVSIPAAAVREAHARFLADLRRELLRFFAAVPAAGSIEIAWITGGGSRLPGMREMISELLGCRCEELDVLGSLSHNLPPDEAAEVGPRIAVAVGLALRTLGAPAGLEFRREDLAFTKRFDRVKFPLAITAMLALFLTVVYALKTQKELVALQNDFGATIPAGARSGRSDPRPEFSGYVGTLLGRHAWFAAGKYYDPREYERLLAEVAGQPVFNRLALIRERIRQYHRKLQTESGIYQELKLGSGLAVLQEMAEVIAPIEKKLGRFLLTDIDLVLAPDDNQRFLRLTFALRGEEYRGQFVLLEDAFKEACRDPKSPFRDVKVDKKEQPFSDGDVPGAWYELRINLKPEKEFPAFP